MCLARVYVAEAEGQSLLMEEVKWVGTEGQRVHIRSTGGEEKSVPGRLREVDFAGARTIVEPTSPLPDSLRELTNRAELFHGHLGPYLVIGLRMGMVGKRLLGFEEHFDVEVEALTGRETPVSCIVDGLQFSTGATLGKGNIEVSEMHNDRPAARIASDHHMVELTVTESALETVEAGLERETGETVAGKIAHMPEEKLFEKSQEG